MAAELEPRILEGRVFTDGVAQETIRDEDGAVSGIRLTCMPGHPSTSAAVNGGMVNIALSEAVTVGPGGTFTLSVEWLDERR